MEQIRILAVDDEPMAPRGYKFVIEDMNASEITFEVDCESDYYKAKDRIAEGYDILLLDIRMGLDENGDVLWGDDLGVYAREVTPEAKIVFITTFNDSFKISDVLKKTSPDGYLIKTDIDEHVLPNCINKVLKGVPYYSDEVLVSIKEISSWNKSLNAEDKKIIRLLSDGLVGKEVAERLGVSFSTYEKRKSKLKEKLGYENKTDSLFIKEAYIKGYS